MSLAPPDDGDPWRETRVVGTRRARVDAYERVSGSAIFPSDIVVPGMLYAAILRCPHPHARVRGGDASAAEARDALLAVSVDHEALPFVTDERGALERELTAML